MPCPTCKSHNLWDDEMYWGCQETDCRFMSNTITNNISPLDSFNGQFQFESEYTEGRLRRNLAKTGVDWDSLPLNEKRKHVAEYLKAIDYC